MAAGDRHRYQHRTAAGAAIAQLRRDPPAPGRAGRGQPAAMDFVAGNASESMHAADGQRHGRGVELAVFVAAPAPGGAGGAGHAGVPVADGDRRKGGLEVQILAEQGIGWMPPVLIVGLRRCAPVAGSKPKSVSVRSALQIAVAQLLS